MTPRLSYARSSDGVSIAYTVTGSGPPLVMMPGVPFSNLVAEWRIPVVRQAFEVLAAGLRLVQYDGRGTGHSQRDVSDLSMDAMLRDLGAVVDDVRLGRFGLLGFYNSCSHAIAYAARHPERVTELVLFGGSARGWEPMSGPGTQALLSLIERDWDTFVESATHAWLGWPDDEEGRLAAEWFRTATTPEVARATLQELSGVDVTHEAGSVACPTLVLHRRETPVVPLAMSEGLAALFPDGRLHIVKGRSASLFFEHTDDVVREIVSFIAGDAHPRAAAPPVADAPADRPAGLTRREIDVLRLLAAGETNGDIARQLGVSINTVERHVTNLYRKIDARGRADATAFAVRRGIA